MENAALLGALRTLNIQVRTLRTLRALRAPEAEKHGMRTDVGADAPARLRCISRALFDG